MSEYDRLQKEFLNGSLPKNIEGLYKGELARLMPKTIPEFLAGILTKIWLPWQGKCFYKESHTGDNLFSYSFEWLTKLRFGEKTIVKKEKEGFHAFLFKTSIAKGLMDTIQVLRLDYDLASNPSQIRNVVDELVEVEKNTYLGKAHLKEGLALRTAAFFRLLR